MLLLSNNDTKTKNPLKIDVTEVISGVDEEMIKETKFQDELSDAITEEFKNEAKRTRSRTDWADLMILHTALNSIDKTILEIEELNNSYRDIEKNLIMRIYPKQLRDAGLIKPKTLVGGRERVDIQMFYEAFRSFTIELRDYIDETKKSNDANIKNIRTIVENTLAKHGVKKDDITDDTLTDLNRLILSQETKRSEDVYTASQRMVTIASYVCDENNLRFEFPKQSQVELAKDLRAKLIATQSVGRQAEIFFTYYLGKLLYQHPQLRKDYGDVEKYTNALFQSLSVSKAEFDLDGTQVADALKKIMKSLYNIRGDFLALRLVLSMNVRKGRSKSLVDDWLKTVGKPSKKGD